MTISYRDSGVDIDKANEFVDRLKRLTKGIGGFGGLFPLDVAGYKKPVLVSGTDGVGTKLKVAVAAGRHDTIGIDLVAMSVNDILTVGARPLFFLDYYATSRLDVARAEAVVKGIVRGCEESECVLLGGETAELPGVYSNEEYDLAGFAVGIADAERVVDGSAIKPGDVVLGLTSSGLHSNGYSLARRVLLEHAGLDLSGSFCESTLGEALLAPTRIYVKTILSLLEEVEVKGMVHVTGGGLVDNPPRVLPEGTAIEFETGSWPVLLIFELIREKGNVDEMEMRRTFNMGLGYLLILSPEEAEKAERHLSKRGEVVYRVGRVTEGQREVNFR